MERIRKYYEEAKVTIWKYCEYVATGIWKYCMHYVSPVMISCAIISAIRTSTDNTPFWWNCMQTDQMPRIVDYCRWIPSMGLLVSGLPSSILLYRVNWSVPAGSAEAVTHAMSIRILRVIHVGILFHIYRTWTHRSQGYVCADSLTVAICSFPLMMTTILWAVWLQTTLKRHRSESCTHRFIYVSVLLSILSCIGTMFMRLGVLIQAQGIPSIFENLYLNGPPPNHTYFLL